MNWANYSKQAGGQCEVQMKSTIRNISDPNNIHSKTVRSRHSTSREQSSSASPAQSRKYI